MYACISVDDIAFHESKHLSAYKRAAKEHTITMFCFN